MKIYVNILIFALSFLTACQAQEAIQEKPKCANEAFDHAVNRWLNYTVIPLGVKELSKEGLEKYTILDAREQEEYDVSHIEGAQFIGYKNFDIDQLKLIDKEQAIVVYCSIGYRSEKVGEKLIKAGFKNVYNLYGSIFEWANQGLPLVDKNNQKTNKIHTYNKKWSKWVLNQEYKKTW